MAFGDVVSRALLEVRADVSDAKAKLRDLSAEERKIEQSRIAGIEASNKSLETWVKRIGTAGVALGTFGAATKLAIGGLKEFGREAQLTAAAGSANIGKLSAAFDGLVPKMEVLSFAAKAQHGVLKLNQEQMETLAKAAVTLSRQGMGELNEVLKKLTDSAVKAKAEGLDDLGLSVKEGKTAAETMSNIMGELNKKIAEGGSVASTAADDVQRLAVAWENAKSSALSYVGASLSIENGLKQGRGFLFDVTNVLTLGQAARSVDNRNVREANEMQAAMDAMMSSIVSDESGGPIDPFSPTLGSSITDAGKLRAFMESVRKRIERQQRRSSAGARGPSSVSSLVNMGGTDVIGAGAFGGSLGATAGIGVNDREILDQIEAMRTGDLTKDWFARLEEQRSKKTSFLESTFGKLEDFNAYQTAFSTLTGAVSAGLNAWITGSMSAGQAFKKFISDALAGLASQMAVEALKHTAYAIGSAAFGDVKGAATHSAAAAAFGLGSAAALVAARGLGGGGGAASTGAATGSASASGAAGSGGSGGGSPQPTTINYILVGSDHAENSPRMMQRKAERLVSLADNKTSAGGAF